MEEGLFPHMRSLDSKAAMEEERRLCYVGMTRAEKRLFLTSARYRRRFGGGQPEASIPSRFLNEVPEALVEDLNPQQARRKWICTRERHEVREAAKRNLYTGKTYNSVENIQQFFAERGKAAPQAPPQRPQPSRNRSAQPPTARHPATAAAKRASAPAPRSGIPNMAAERCCAAKGMATMLSSL